MIEVNLVPDVKQDLIRAERIRSVVITAAVLVGIASVGVVLLLVLWMGVQATRGMLSDKTIKEEYAKLSQVKDLSSTLTIQNQLDTLPKLHEEKHADSRIFDVLTTINPAAPNNVAISKLAIDSTEKTIKIEAQAAGGYPALEVFKKTIAATKFQYAHDGTEESRPLATSMSDGERSYGKDANDQTVLRFELTFVYPEELFTPYLDNARIVGPVTTNVTDSFVGIPKSLFSPKANDTEKGN